MKATPLFLPPLLIAATLGQSYAATTTWLGSFDQSWTNTANWSAGVPVDTNGNPGLNHNAGDSIVFGGMNMPTTNIPGLGGVNFNIAGNTSGSTPTLILNSGGSLSITAGANNIGGIVTDQMASGTRTIFSVGDGIGTANTATGSTLNLTLTGALNRHQTGIHVFVVENDGLFNVTMTSGALPFALDGNRNTQLLLSGGGFFTGSAIDRSTEEDAGVNTFVDFQEIGSSFTADYGSDYANLAAVNAGIGATSFFRSSNGHTLNVVEDAVNNSFTITAVPEPSAVLLGGLGVLALMRRRR